MYRIALCSLVALILTLIVMTGAAPQADAQSPAPAREESRVDQQLALANVAFEPLGAGDLVYVAVTDCPEVTRSYRISANGDLKLALLNTPIHAMGVKPADLEQTIAQALKQQHILVEPSVSVSVLEYRSRPVNVVGAVRHSVTFQAMGDVKLLDAIARADGLSQEAGPEILISSIGDSAATSDKIRHIPVKQLLSGADPALNVPLHGGEEIRVPEAAKLYITGNVKLPGAFPLNETGTSTVLKALALCQGLLPYSQKTAYVYRQEAGSAERKEIPIPLYDIEHRKAPDVTLQANDVLFVQDNSGKRLTATVIDKITGFGSMSAAAAAYRY
jgi:polysaccharide export outer membrane protein